MPPTGCYPHAERPIEFLPPDFSQEVGRLHHDLRRLLGGVVIPDDGECYLAQELEEGHLTAVSDGSVQQGTGSHAWVLVGREHDMLYMIGAGPVDGSASLLSSYRAGLQGQIAILLAICLLAKTYGVTGTAITANDNQSAVRTVKSLRYPPCLKQHNTADADLLMLGQGILSKTSMKLKPVWVKGHADETKPEDELSSLEHLNIWMDAVADDVLHTPQPGFAPSPHISVFPHEHWAVDLNGQRVTKNSK